MFALIEYFFTITLILSYHQFLYIAIPLAILCTTVGLFGDWPHRIRFLKSDGTRRHALSNNTTASTETTTDTNLNSTSNHSPSSPISLGHDNDSTSQIPTAAHPSSAPEPAPAWSTPARVRGIAFALALLRLWYTGESRALSQFMFTVNSLVLVGYGSLWLWKRHQRYGHFMLWTRTEHGWVFRWRRAIV